MRPVILLCAVVLGTAARFALPHLPLLGRPRRRRRGRLGAQSSQSSSSDDESHVRDASLCPPNPYVVALLDKIAPEIPAAQFVASHSADHDCTFCLDTICETSAPVRLTPCNHVFHADCLKQWVLYRASDALNWRHYIVSDDGRFQINANPPTCPNCLTRLPVLPARQVRGALLTSIKHSLGLPDISTAARMYDAGLILRYPLHPTYHTNAPVHSPLPPFPSRPTFFSSIDPTPTAVSFSFSQSSSLPVAHPFLTRSIALVSPPNVRMLERNAWTSPVLPSLHPAST